MRELVAWVDDNVAALLERKIPQTGGAPYWCRRWWLHPEAIARFEAARRCWVEAVAGEGAAMVVYFEHLDAMLAALCGENGPFCGCVGGQHNDTAISTPLGQDEPDEDYYAQLREPERHTMTTEAARPGGEHVSTGHPRTNGSTWCTAAATAHPTTQADEQTGHR